MSTSELSITLLPLAGGGSLGANAYLLQIGSRSLLLDCGSADSRAPGWLDALPVRPDAVWLSHAHFDHIGALPHLVSRFPRIEAFATSPTRALLGPTLASVMPRERADALSSLVSRLSPSRPLRWELPEEALSVVMTPRPCGHVWGAASLTVDISGAEMFLRIFYLSDFCLHEQPDRPGATLPDEGVDFLIMEGVLATARSASERDYEQELDDLLAFLAPPVPRLVAVASLGEASSLAAALHARGEELVLHEHMRSFLEPGLRDHVHWASLGRCRESLARGGLVLAPGARLDEGSPARLLVPAVQQRADARIAVLNGLPRGSFAARLMAGTVPSSRARTHHALLVNHAPRPQLLETVRRLEPARVVLVHNTKRNLSLLRKALRSECPELAVKIARDGRMLRVPSESG